MTSRDPVQTPIPAHIEALAAQNAQAVNLFQVPEDIARGQCVLVSDEQSADIERDFPPDIPLLMVMTTDVWCYDAPDQQRPNPSPAPRGAVFARVPQDTDQQGVELSTGRKVQYGDEVYDEPPLYNAWVCVRSGARQGWIFGAFLKTFQPHERPQMLRIRRRYISDGVETSYASTVMDMSPGATRGQMRHLTPAEREALQSQRRWSEPLSAQDVEISDDHSDDFLKAYASIAALPQPLYVTADLLLHMQHKLFQELLIHFETEWLINGLGELLCGALSEATQRRAACAPALWSALDRARVVLTVAARLWGDEPAIDEALRPLVEQELAAVNADGALPLWTTGQRPDGGWMQPRSHYTQTEALSQYFKAMSYLSFCQFPLAPRAQRPFPLPQLRGAPVSEQEALEGARVAAIMCLLWCADAALIRDHLAFDHALTTLFGRQDGLALATLSEQERAALSWEDLLDDARVRSWAADLLRAHAPAQPPDQEDALYGSFGLMAQRPSLDGLLIELKNERLYAAPPSSAWLLAALGADAPQALTEASIEAPPLLTCDDGTWRTQPLPKDPNATDQSLWETARTRAESLTDTQWLTSYYQGIHDDQWRALVYAPSPSPPLTQTQVKLTR
jgi:hypothetical protein